MNIAFQGKLNVLAVKGINRGFDIQAEFANKIGRCVLRLEGFTSQTPKPLNRPIVPLSEHQKFVDFSKSLENSQSMGGNASKSLIPALVFRNCGAVVAKFRFGRYFPTTRPRGSYPACYFSPNPASPPIPPKTPHKGPANLAYRL